MVCRVGLPCCGSRADMPWVDVDAGEFLRGGASWMHLLRSWMLDIYSHGVFVFVTCSKDLFDGVH